MDSLDFRAQHLLSRVVFKRSGGGLAAPILIAENRTSSV